MPLRSKLALLLCLSASPLAAQTTIHVPADQPTIQAGINAANSGDTVLVAPGTYDEKIDFKGKAITVASAAGAATTIIQGGGTDGTATVYFHNGEPTTAILSGFTITGGGNPLGGGYPNAFSPYGGAFIAAASPTLLNNVFTGNYCSHIVTAYASPLLQGNRITNLLTQPSGQCYFPNAVYLFGDYFSVGAPTLTGNIIENNITTNARAGGVVIWSSSATLIGNTIRNNTGQSGGIAVVNTDSVGILNNLIYGNTGTSNDYDASGGISILAPYSSVGTVGGLLAGNTIANNTVGTAADPSSFHGSEVTLDGNLAQFVLVNNIFYGSQSGTAALGCASPDPLAITPLVIDHDDLFHTPGAPIATVGCDIPSGQYGNLALDPLFNSPSTDDYTLRARSPAIDTGNNSAPSMQPTDLAGNPRIVDATSLGHPVIDMGAFEYTGTQDANHLVLSFTPSTYSPGASGQPPLLFVLKLSPGRGTTGPVNIYVDDVYVLTVNLSETGTATFSLPGLTAGTHAFLATYAGSSTFPPTQSVKFYLHLLLPSTAVTLTSSLNPATYGTPVTFTVNATGPNHFVPSPITLTDTTAGLLLATLTPDATTGLATFTTSSLSLGNHVIVASYAGTSTYSPSSAQLTQQITPYSNTTTTTLTSNYNPSYVNGPITFAATVASQGSTLPTGSVNFVYNNVVFGSSPLSPQLGYSWATISYSNLPIGSDVVTAVYVPTSTFTTSQATLTEQIVAALPTTTSLTCSPLTLNIGDTVTLSASASAGGSSISGTFVFSDAGTTFGTWSGITTTASEALTTVGLHNFKVSFTPQSSTYAPSSATCSVTVGPYPLTITLAAAPNPATVGQTVTLSTNFAAIYPSGSGGHQFTGQLAFYDGATLLTQFMPSATGFTFSTASLAVGSHTLTAVYTDPIYGTGTTTSNPITVKVNPAPSTATLTVLPTTASFHTPINLLVSVAAAAPPGPSVPTGTVTFTVDGAALPGTPALTNGSIGIFLNNYRPGTHQVSCTYSGDAKYAPATCNTVTLTIFGATTTLSLRSSLNPAYVGQTVTFTAAVTGIQFTPTGLVAFPTGALTLLEGTTVLGTGALDPTGHASLSTSTLSAGTHLITVSYAGDAVFAPAISTPFSEEIDANAFTIALSSASLSLKSGTDGTTLVQLSSVGNFSGPLQLALGQAPPYATAALSAASVTLTAGSTGTSTLTLHTMALAALHPHEAPGPHRAAEVLAASLAGLISLLLLPTARGRRRLLTRALLLMLAAVALSSATGCLNEWYTRHTVAPGVYTLPVTATDAAGNAHTASLTVTITP